ncbi:MAG: glycosyltransferase family protein [Longimicrobiales bacterium]
MSASTGQGKAPAEKSPDPCSKPTVLWVSWERHRRTLELARFLGIEATSFDLDLPRLIRYSLLSLKTLALVWRTRPKVLIIQNPSIVLALITALMKPLLSYRLLVDAHNQAIRPDTRALRLLRPIQVFIQKMADVTIVTNDSLARDVSENGGHPIVLPDRLPTPPHLPAQVAQNGRKVVFVCTFSVDEPFEEFLEAASTLPEDVQVFVTGRAERIPLRWKENPPPTTRFTGFLPENQYWSLLSSADLVVDLTTREDCLVCGAYEAVAVGTPLLLTDTDALQDYFGTAAVYCRNGVDDIRTALLDSLDRVTALREDMQEAREQIRARWEIMGARFFDLVWKHDEAR